MSLEGPLRRARLAQGLTVGWMVIEGAVAVGAGVVAHSVALTAFGFDSYIELFSAAVVLRRVIQRTAAEERGSLTGGERTASLLAGWALFALPHQSPEFFETVVGLARAADATRSRN